MKPDSYGLTYDPVTHELGATMLTVSISSADEECACGATFALSARDQGNLGLVIVPFGNRSFSESFDDWRVTLDLPTQVQAFALGATGPMLIAGAGEHQMHASLTAERLAEIDGPALFVGSADGAHLKIDQLSIVRCASAVLAGNASQDQHPAGD